MLQWSSVSDAIAEMVRKKYYGKACQLIYIWQINHLAVLNNKIPEYSNPTVHLTSSSLLILRLCVYPSFV